MRRIFNEIQRAETISGDDFTVLEVISDLKGEILKLTGSVKINGKITPAEWNVKGIIESLDGLPCADQQQRDAYSLIIKRTLTSNNSQLQVFWMAATHYLLTKSVKHGVDFILLPDGYVGFIFDRLHAAYKQYSRKSDHLHTLSKDSILFELQYQPYYLHMQSKRALKMSIPKGIDLVCSMEDLNLDVDFETLKGGHNE